MKLYCFSEIVFSIIYVIIIILLIRKINKVHESPNRYNNIPGYVRYRKSKFYRPPNWEYDQYDLPKTGWQIITWVILLGTLTVLLTFGSNFFIEDDCAYSSLLGNGRNEIGILLAFVGIICMPALFSNIMIFWLPFPGCASLVRGVQSNSHGSCSRAEAYRKVLMQFLAAFIIFVPVFLLSIFNYWYVDDEQFVVNPYLSFVEEEYNFSELKSCNAVYDSNGNLEHFIIENENGCQFDIMLLYDKAPGEEEPCVSYIIDRCQDAGKVHFNEYT